MCSTISGGELMTDIKFPRRWRDDHGNWIIERPLVDPAVERQQAIDYCKKILSETWPDGSPIYVADLRAWAKQRLQELRAVKA